MTTHNANSSNASLSVPLHHVPRVNNTNLHSLMTRPSYLFPQHPHAPHQYHQQQQQQPAHQMTRPNPQLGGHVNPAAQRIAGMEALETGPGAPVGLIDLSCSAPRFRHHYQQLQNAAGDVAGKVFPPPPAPEQRDGRCQNAMGSRASLQRDGVNDLKLMIASSPSNTAQQVLSITTAIGIIFRLFSF